MTIWEKGLTQGFFTNDYEWQPDAEIYTTLLDKPAKCLLILKVKGTLE